MYFNKMKIVVLIILVLQGFICISLQFSEQKPQYKHEPLVNIIGVNETIVYFTKNIDGMLIDSILRDFINQPVLLVRGENVTLKGFNNRNPNIILLTETLNIEEFKTETFKTLLFSYWSPLHLVITTRSENYICKNGSLSKNAFAETKKYLNELWQVFRIVQVAVSFPYTCPKHYVIYDGKEWSGNAVYNRSIKLIDNKNKNDYASVIAYNGDPRYLTKDYPIRANIFYRFPTSILDCNGVAHYTNIKFDSNNRFCGLDGLVMHDYIDHYKYKLSIPIDKNCDKYGFVDVDHNNTITGSLGCIMSNEIDMSFNSRFISQYTKDMNFLYYVSHDSLCVIMKRPSNIPLWHYAYNIFTPFVWIALLTSLGILGTVAWLSAKISTKSSDEKSLKLHSFIYKAIHTALFGVLVKNDGKFLILKGTCLLCSVILLAVYQQHFNYQFTTRSHYPEIKSLDELYTSRCVLYTSQSIFEVLKLAKDEDDVQQATYLNSIRIDNNISSDYILEHPNTGTLGRKHDMMIEVLKNYTDMNGIPQLYVIDDCFHYYLSYIARKDFLFLDDTMKFMMRLVEAGLPDRYYIWTQRTFNVADRLPSIGPEPRPFTSIDLKKLRVAYGFLLIGYVVCGLVFIVEKCKGR